MNRRDLIRAAIAVGVGVAAPAWVAAQAEEAATVTTVALTDGWQRVKVLYPLPPDYYVDFFATGRTAWTPNPFAGLAWKLPPGCVIAEFVMRYAEMPSGAPAHELEFVYRVLEGAA